MARLAGELTEYMIWFVKKYVSQNDYLTVNSGVLDCSTSVRLFQK